MIHALGGQGCVASSRRLARPMLASLAALLLWAGGSSLALARSHPPAAVVVLVHRGPGLDGAFWESFLLALKIQLGTYDIHLIPRQAVPPRGGADRALSLAQAQTLLDEQAALAVIWLAPRHGAEISLRAQLVVRQGASVAQRFVTMARGAGVERSLAQSLRTVLRIPLAAQRRSPSGSPIAPPATHPSSAPAFQPQLPSSPAAASRPSPPLARRFSFGLDFVTELFATEGALRFGPELAVAMLLTRRLEAQLHIGPRLPQIDHQGPVDLERTTALAAAGLAWVWRPRPRLRLSFGPRFSAALVAVSANLKGDGSGGSAVLSELALGAEGGVVWALIEPLSLRARFGIDLLTRDHEVVLGAGRSLRSGPLALRLAFGVGWRF